MGDIQRAYELLNRTLNLKLSKEALFRAEAIFKFDFARQERFGEGLRRDPSKLMADWEFKSHLVPRSKPLTEKAINSMAGVADEVADEIRKSAK